MDIIFDIDNTLSDDAHRVHYIQQNSKNWDAYFDALIDDAPITPTLEMLRTLYDARHRIILCTGRPEKYRYLTVQWLQKYDVPANALFMRQPKDGKLRNAQVKRAMIDRVREANYNPVAVFEDNPSSAAMWKECGLVVYQIA